jgi:DNA polymerase-1
MKILLLVDGNNLLYRAYHALPPLTDRSGEMANAVFGISNMLLKAINEVNPTHVACAFDSKAPTFRHVEFEKYKAQRKPPPPDLYPQLPKVQKVLRAFGIPYFVKDGYEADDILGTLTAKLLKKRQVDKVVILSGDRDVLQLVDGSVKVQMPGWNLGQTTLYGANEVKEKFGLEPHQMVDYKSLIGDPSDNIPGIAGIGPKTAAILLQKSHTLENLFEHIDEQGETVKAKLVAGKDIALAAKKLVELDLNVDIEFDVSSLEFKPDWGKVKAEYEELGFKSIVAKLPGGRESDESKESDVSNVSKKKNDDQLKLI